MTKRDNTANHIVSTLNKLSQHNVNQADKKYLKYKNAKVTSYDKNTSIATVQFADIDHEYRYYNKSGEILQENDSVKVEYTNNLAQGIITLKYGEWKIEKKTKQYVTKHIFSNEDTELSEVVSCPLNLNFTVDDDNSDVVVTANQYISVTNDGTIENTYVIDGEDIFKTSEDITKGNYILTHIIPISVLTGNHNLIVRQLSADAKGLTETGNFKGVISGYISGITIELPPNDNLIIKVSIPEDGYELNLNGYGNLSVGTTGMLYWGDGSVLNNYNYVPSVSHVYEKAGDYEIVITSAITYMPSALLEFGDMGVMTELAFPDATTMIGGIAGGCSSLRSVSFGSEFTSIGEEAFNNCSSLFGTLNLPKKLVNLGKRAFYGCSSLTKIVAECPNLINIEGFIFDSCTSLIDVEWNAPVLGDLQFSYCSNLKNISLGKGIVVIPNQCFQSCISLNNVVIPEGVTTIIFNAFQSCMSLNSVKFPSTLKEIGTVAFGGTALKSVSLPSDCTYYSNSFPSDCVISGGVLIS